MANNRYYIAKKGDNRDIVFIDYEKISGFDVTPKNRITYDGITVNKLVIIKQSFIEKILKKKIKRKLEVYLQFIIEFIDSDSEDDGSLNEVLSDLTRYKEIVNYRYRKHLGEGYIDLLLKKIELLEYELKVKLYMIEERKNILDKENVSSKSR